MDDVKPRYDNGGTEFGLIHRKLPKWCCMFDVDAMKATANLDLRLKKDECFFEYETDFKNSTITFKAMFEVKYKNSERIKDEMCCLKTGSSLWAELQLAERIGCRFFYVIATNGLQPFDFFEYKNGSFQFVGRLEYDDSNRIIRVNNFWCALNLI